MGEVVATQSSERLVVVVLVKELLHRVSAEENRALLHGLIILIFPLAV